MNYNKKTWEKGNVVTANDLNNIEQGIETAAIELSSKISSSLIKTINGESLVKEGEGDENLVISGVSAEQAEEIGKISTLEEKVNTLEEKTDSLEEYTTDHEARIDTIESKVGVLEGYVNTLRGENGIRIDTIENNITELEARISILENKDDGITAEYYEGEVK